MPETNVPKWLNLDALADDSVITDLAKIKDEAEALAPSVRDFAIRAFRATKAWDLALSRADLPDEVWELAKDACGAEAVFEVLGQLVDDLNVARLEKTGGDEAPAWAAKETARLEGANR